MTRVIDGGEPAEFKSLFKHWKDKDATVKLTFGRRISMTTVQTKFDAKVLHENPQMVSKVPKKVDHKVSEFKTYLLGKFLW